MTSQPSDNGLQAIIEQRDRALARGYTEGDINHNVQPVIGQMRLLADRVRSHNGSSVQVDLRTLDSWVRNLHLACDAETAFLSELKPAEVPDDGP